VARLENVWSNPPALSLVYLSRHGLTSVKALVIIDLAGTSSLSIFPILLKVMNPPTRRMKTGTMVGVQKTTV